MSGETMREAVARAMDEALRAIESDARLSELTDDVRESSEAFLSSYGAEHRRTVAGIWESGIDAAAREVG